MGGHLESGADDGDEQPQRQRPYDNQIRASILLADWLVASFPTRLCCFFIHPHQPRLDHFIDM